MWGRNAGLLLGDRTKKPLRLRQETVAKGLILSAEKWLKEAVIAWKKHIGCVPGVRFNGPHGMSDQILKKQCNAGLKTAENRRFAVAAPLHFHCNGGQDEGQGVWKDEGRWSVDDCGRQ